MGSSRYIGRVGTLAVALGIGAAVASMPGVAWADGETDTSTPAADTTTTTDTSVSTTQPDTSTTETDTTTPADKTPSTVEPSTRETTPPTTGSSTSETATSSPSGKASKLDPRVGVVVATGGAHTGSYSGQGRKKSDDSTTRRERSVEEATDPGPAADPPDEGASHAEDSTITPAPNRMSSRSATTPAPDQPGAGSDTARQTDRRAATGTPTATVSAQTNSQSTVRRPAVDVTTGQTSTGADSRAGSPSIHATLPTKTRAVPAASRAPEVPGAPVVTVQTMLATVALGPLATPGPVTPADPAGAWIVAAWARRESEQQAKAEAPINATDPVFTSLALDGAEADQQTFAMMAAKAETNTAPEASPAFTRADLETGTVEGAINGTDVDGDPLSYTVTGAPANGTVSVDPNTGQFAYAPTDAARLAAAKTSSTDRDSFTVMVSDGQASTPVTVSVPLSSAQLAWSTSVNTAASPTGVATSPDGQYTYVANQGSGTVSVVDNTTNTVVKTITVGSLPTGVAVSPDGNTVYVTNRASGTVSMIDTNPASPTYNTVAKTVKVGSSPTDVAVSPDGNEVYVTNQSSNTVSVIDTDPTHITTYRTVVKTITVGTGPTGVAVSPDSNTVYVTNRTSGTVSVIDTNPANTTTYNRVVTTIRVGTNPTDVAVSPDGGRVYVTNYGSSSVSVIDTKAGSATYRTVVKTITVGSNPNSVALSPDGSLAYVANGRDTVSVIDTRTNAVVRTVTINSVAQPLSGTHYVSVSPDGNTIYVTDTNDRKLRVISMTGIFENTAPQVSRPPTIDPLDQATGVVTGKVNFAPDADGDRLTYTVTGAPAHGTVTVDPNTGAFTYTPTSAARQQAATTPEEDTDTFTITASDGYTTTSTPVTVTISPAQPAELETTTTPITVGAGPSGSAVIGNRAYVINSNDNTVSVIDTATNTVVGEPIVVGSGPLSVAASPDGDRVYVTNSYDNTVSVIDTTTNQVTATIAVPVQPGYIPEWDYEYPNVVTEVAVSPDGDRVYVNATDGTVSVIDTDPTSATYNTVISTSSASLYSDMKVSPDGSRLYATRDGDFGSPTLDVIDTDSMTVVDSVQVGPEWNLDAFESEFTDDTYNMAVSPDGTRTYVTYSVQQVHRGDGGHTSGEFIYDSRGVIWHAEGGYDAVSVIDTDPTSATYNTEIARITVPAGAQDVALSPDGSTAYVTSPDGKTVTMIDTTTNTVIGTFTTDETSAGPRDVYVGFNSVRYPTRYVTVAPNGTVYVTDYTDGKVYATTVGDATAL